MLADVCICSAEEGWLAGVVWFPTKVGSDATEYPGSAFPHQFGPRLIRILNDFEGGLPQSS